MNIWVFNYFQFGTIINNKPVIGISIQVFVGTFVLTNGDTELYGKGMFNLIKYH